ncbi:hypothetical protein Tco_0466315 [Tanacetum coccineum]
MLKNLSLLLYLVNSNRKKTSLMDFQDSPDDEEDTIDSQEYLNDLEEEFQERALSANSSQHKPELRPTKDFEAKYNKVKAKLVLLSSSASASKSSMVKNKGLVAEAYECDEEDVSSDDNEIVEVKVIMALADDENIVVGKESARNSDDTKVFVLGVDRPWLSEAEEFIFPNHDTSIILLAESQMKVIDPLVVVTDSSVTDYDSADESLVCSTPLPPLEKLVGDEPVSGPKTIKSILKSNSTFKAETLKGVTLNEPTSVPAKANKNVLASKRNSVPASKLKNVKIEDDIPFQDGSSLRSQTSRPLKPFPPCKHCGFNDHQSDDCVSYPTLTAAEIQVVEKERKAKNILLMAIPKEHMRRFHGMDDAKEIWEAIRTRFGGNANSKKMQKAVFKQQFKAFTISSSEGLEKGYDRFQQLLSQLEAHGAEVSTEDANHKFLRSLPPAWSNLAMTMRTKPDVDTLSIDDLYNNLRVFEQEIQVGFYWCLHTSLLYFLPTNIPDKRSFAGFADEVIYSLFAKQSEDWDLLHEDLEQIDDLDIEEMDINWQIAMIAIRMKKFYKKTIRRVRMDGKTPVGFDKKKLEFFNCYNTGHFARECTAKGTHDGKKKRDSFYRHQEAVKQEKNQMGLLTMDDGIVNWGEHTEVKETNDALMAINSSNEVSLCSKTCIDSYNTLKTLYDEQMNQLGDQEAQRVNTYAGY